MTRPLAIVTGSFRRLGGHLAVRLGEAGWDVVLHASVEGTPDPWVLDRLDTAGASIQSIHADLSDDAAVADFVPNVIERCGRVPTLLVNNASCFRADDARTPTAETVRNHLSVNAVAPFVIANAFAQAGGTSVINILDQRIAHPHGDQLAYTLSKQALAEATRTLAATLAPSVRVNAVAPGLTIPTGDYSALQVERLAAAMPLGRLPTPDDVADAVLFLATARASTGQVIFVDGGAGMTRFERDFVHLERE